MSTRLFATALLNAILASAAAPSYTVQTIAGSDYLGDGGPANRALLATVEGLAADALGNYYLADTDSHRIRRISPRGIITTIAGTGSPGYSGDGGPAASAQLNTPYGLAADLAGSLYVADFGNHCVRKITADGQISTIAGLSAELSGPRNLAVDLGGNLYISDFLASRVYRLSAQGILTAIAGSPQAKTLGDNGPATLAQLKNPAGLAIDLVGNLYIADSGNKKIRKITQAGAITSLNISLLTPVGLAITLTNELYIADPVAGILMRVLSPNSNKPSVRTWPEACREVTVDHSGTVVVANGNTVTQFNGTVFTLLAGGNDFLFAGDNGPATSARLNRPLALAFDPAGSLYIADSASKRIRRMSPDGVIRTFVSGLSTPAGLAFDGATGNLYIADAGRHSILVAKIDGSVTTIAGIGQGFKGDGGPAALAQFNAPSALAFDSLSRTLYISDSGNNRVRMITPDGTIRTLAQLQGPSALAIDSHGVLFAVESGQGRVVRIMPSGAVDSVSDAGVWINPRGLAIDGDGTFFISDVATDRITRIDRDGTVLIAGGTGEPGLSGDNGAAALARFDTPSGVALGPNGVLYVADTANNRVRALAMAGGITQPPPQALRTIAVLNAASRLSAPIAAGELVTIIGISADEDVQINSRSGKPLAPQPFQQSGDVTFLMADALDGTVEIQVLSGGVPLTRITQTVAATSLGVFAGMIRNADGTLNSMENPAGRGSAITIYGTGEGRLGTSVTATLAGETMDVVSFGASADSPGMFELVAFVPSGYFPAGAMSLRVASSTSTSQPGVTVYVH